MNLADQSPEGLPQERKLHWLKTTFPLDVLGNILLNETTSLKRGQLCGIILLTTPNFYLSKILSPPLLS